METFSEDQKGTGKGGREYRCKDRSYVLHSNDKGFLKVYIL